MKKLIIALCLMTVGFVGFSNASSYYTTESTGVIVTTATNVEILSVTVSTGDATSYVMIVDSHPAGAKGVWDRAKYSSSQFFLPPIMVSSNTVQASLDALYLGSTLKKYDLTNGAGEGLEVKHGIVILQTIPGAMVTVNYRKKR